MTFVWITLGSLAVLGVIAALASWGDTDAPVVSAEGDCSSCSGRDDCKLAGLMNEKNQNNVKECRPECNKTKTM